MDVESFCFDKGKLIGNVIFFSRNGNRYARNEKEEREALTLVSLETNGFVSRNCANTR